MSMTTVGGALGARSVREEQVALWGFAATLFLSALLLFSVQPMFARMVLPKLGGSPSVWAVSMCFFQAVLLAGYCYAHALNRFAPARFAPMIHLTVMGLAVLALPIGLAAGWQEPPAGDAYFWLIGALAMGVGLPFFAVSANAPLLQSWFARTGHPHASDPYFLYGASNLGSLIALLAYPVAIEPLLGLSAQASLWTKGFLVLGFMIAGSGLVMLASGGASAKAERAGDRVAAAPVTIDQRLAWIGLAFVPSGLLVAFTTHVTTDIASAPFLWVIPLAMFLATFILVFTEKPKLSHKMMLRLQPAAVAFVVLGISSHGNAGWITASIGGVAAFFITTMVCHRELYEKRPESAHLTEFYLWMSLGGVLGGIFSAIVAPQIFNAIYEFPLLLLAGMACRPGVIGAMLSRAEKRELTAIVWISLTILMFLAAAIDGGLLFNNGAPRVILIVAMAGMTLVAGGAPVRQLVYTAIMTLTVMVLPTALNEGDAERSFFGIHRVSEIEDGRMRVLLHGTTVHGAMRLKEADGKPVKAALPATYYHPESPMARGVRAARVIAGRPDGAVNVGIVGLGAGSMACHSRTADSWRFYEIDPVVVRIARDPKRFDFISRCRPGADIVLGDARLTVAKEKAKSFDYLVIDAFSSDSVPVHLLTVEAIRLYLDKITDKGLLALHVSNRHLALVEVAAATALSVPGTAVAFVDDSAAGKTFDKSRSHVMLIAKSEAALAPVLAWHDAKRMEKPGVAPWTDDYSDILTAIWRKYRE